MSPTCQPSRFPLIFSVAAASLVIAIPVTSKAEPREVAGYADPPTNPDDPQGRPYEHREFRDDRDRPSDRNERPYRDPHDDSPVRASVGSVGRVSSDSVRPGLFAAIDLGRGPAGFRMSAAWVRVGYDDPLSQYTGELTLTVPLRSAFRPVFGVGGGLARTYRVNDAGAHVSGGANLGVGTARVGVEYRLPFTEVDARAALGATATMPAIRASDAPKLDPWLLLGAAVTIGF